MTHDRSLHLSFREDAPDWRAKSCQKRGVGLVTEDAERAWLVSVIWKAFPEARSEADLAERVARYLTRKGRPVEVRTVRYWLRSETSPHFRYVTELLALAGAERAFEFIFGTRSRK